LAGRRVLDVGCGSGAIALWAALHGASHVTGLEPETDGSTQSTLSQFARLTQDLGLDDRVAASPKFLGDFPSPAEPFDVAVLYNVINHINEPATERLHLDTSAEEEFLPDLLHLRSLLSPNAVVIVADCARNNFWNSVGLRGPLTPTIEWHKHQEPDTWTRVFERAGFERHDLRWSPISPLYFLGDHTSSHALQYFAASHFVLRFRPKLPGAGRA
jgi:SAM-dependent methyltransferase